MAHEPMSFDDEIDLRELIITLWKRRYLIFGVTGAAIGLALIVSTWVLPPVYKSEVRFFLPDFGESVYLQQQSTASTQRSNAFPRMGGLGMTPEQYADYALSDVVLEPLLAVASQPFTVSQLRDRLSVELVAERTALALTASAPTAEQSHMLATVWLESFTDAVTSYVARRIDQALEEAEADLAAIQTSLASIGELFQEAPAERDQVLEVAAAIAYGDAYSTALRERARLLELKKSLPERVAPEILSGPTLPAKPGSPRVLLNVIVAGVLGLMMGTFAALGLEWWKSVGDEEERRAA